MQLVYRIVWVGEAGWVGILIALVRDKRLKMFNTIFSVNLDRGIKIGKNLVTNLAYKRNILGSEVLFLDFNGQEAIMLVCRLPDELRDLLNSIELE